MSRKVFVLRRGSSVQRVVLEGRAGSWRVLEPGPETAAALVALPDGRISILRSDGRQICGRVAPRSHGVAEISTANGIRRLSLTDPLHDLLDHSADGDQADAKEEEVRALMPGRVVEITVSTGDRVEVGEMLLVLEAMKMQNEIRAARGGVVEEIGVKAGEAVETGALLCRVRQSSD